MSVVAMVVVLEQVPPERPHAPIIGSITVTG